MGVLSLGLLGKFVIHTPNPVRTTLEIANSKPYILSAPKRNLKVRSRT